MKVDLYIRAVLTVIAAALVYLCVVFTPLPVANAQRAARPGDDTGPAQCVIVGWNTSDRVPVQVLDSITLKTMGEMKVTGTVQTEPRMNSATRVIVAGWEENVAEAGRTEISRGTFRAFRTDPRTTNPRALPVTVYDPQ